MRILEYTSPLVKLQNYAALCNNLSMQYVLPAIMGFLLTIGLSFAALRFFPKWNLMDKPHLYGLTRRAIPYYGGLIIFLGTIIPILLFVPLSKQLLGLLIAAILVMLIGFFDDLWKLSPLLRLFVQFIAAVILVAFGVGILSISLPFFGIFDFTTWEMSGIYVWSAIFTVFWVMTILNSMNFVDGISGLSSGVSFIASSAIFVLSVHPGLHENPDSQVAVATIAIILASVSLAFLLFDFPKPKILMGDTGSTFLGFMLASLAIFSGGKVATAFLVLGLPILDMVWVVLRRTFVDKKKFWHGDLKHLHHRLMDLGISQKKVVIMYLFVTAVLGVSAVSFVSGQQKLFMLISLIVLMILLATALILLPKKR